jgi:L-asparaginase
MIDTAKVLMNIPAKTIVMTGSMYPAQFRDSDAVFNIGCAVTAAQILEAGVYIVMNGRIFKPHNVKKNVELNRFEEKIK